MKTAVTWFKNHPHPVFRSKRDHRLQFDLMARREPHSEALRDRRQHQRALHPGEALADAHSRAAAEREILEETGVVIRAGEPIFAFDLIEKDEAGILKFHYVIIDLKAEYISGEPLAADDAEDARWLAPEDLGSFNIAPVTLELLKKLEFLK